MADCMDFLCTVVLIVVNHMTLSRQVPEASRMILSRVQVRTMVRMKVQVRKKVLVRMKVLVRKKVQVHKKVRVHMKMKARMKKKEVHKMKKVVNTSEIQESCKKALCKSFRMMQVRVDCRRVVRKNRILPKFRQLQM